MSSERRTRLASLIGELEMLERRLADRETPEDALDFLDRLVRCETFPGGEIQRMSGDPILKAAAARRTEHAAALATLAARALDLEALLERAYSIIAASERGESPYVLDWARGLLRLANITPHLADDTQRRAAEVIEEVLRLVEANPFAFVETAGLAKERRAEEHPQKIRDTLGTDLLDAFAEAEELAAYDDEHTSRDPLSLKRQRKPSAAATDSRMKVVDLFSRSGTAEENETASLPAPLLFAAEAKDYGIGEHALLRRMDEGEFVLTRIGEGLYVDWYGEGVPSLALLKHGALRSLPSQPIEDGLRWQLPQQTEGIHLEARLGEARVELVIPA